MWGVDGMEAAMAGDEGWRSGCRSLWRTAAACCGDGDQAATAVVWALHTALEGRRQGGGPADVWSTLAARLRDASLCGAPSPHRGLRGALAALPSDQRLAVALVDLGGLQTDRAAQVAGTDRATLTRRRRAGLAALARRRHAAALGA